VSETTLDVNEMAWEETSSYPQGTMIKVLRDERQARSVLLKLPAGFRMDAHSHTCCEQHFVLEGKYESGGKEHGPGCYRCIPAHAEHGPFSSRTGAVILVLWGD